MMIFAGISGFAAVLTGAAAAHWLSGTLGPEDLARIEKAASYQMYHTLALLAAIAIAQTNPALRLHWSARLFMTGIVLFSGSLYAYSALHWKPLVFVTPLGGLAFMAGWLSLARAAWRRA